VLCFDQRNHCGWIAAGDGEAVCFHRGQVVRGGERRACEGQLAWVHVRHASKGPEVLMNIELGRE
jgi:hypothetical protein